MGHTLADVLGVFHHQGQVHAVVEVPVFPGINPEAELFRSGRWQAIDLVEVQEHVGDVTVFHCFGAAAEIFQKGKCLYHHIQGVNFASSQIPSIPTK